MDEITEIVNKLITDFAEEDEFFISVNQLNNSVVASVYIEYDIDGATGHVVWDSIVPTAELKI